MARPKGIAWQAVERLAEAGVDVEDIILSLGLPSGPLERQRKRFDETVARGHAKFRAEVAKRLKREGVFKGKAHSLLALGRMHLGLDQKAQDENAGLEALQAVTGAGERLLAVLEQLAKNRTQDARTV